MAVKIKGYENSDISPHLYKGKKTFIVDGERSRQILWLNKYYEPRPEQIVGAVIDKAIEYKTKGSFSSNDAPLSDLELAITDLPGQVLGDFAASNPEAILALHSHIPSFNHSVFSCLLTLTYGFAPVELIEDYEVLGIAGNDVYGDFMLNDGISAEVVVNLALDYERLPNRRRVNAAVADMTEKSRTLNVCGDYTHVKYLVDLVYDNLARKIGKICDVSERALEIGAVNALGFFLESLRNGFDDDFESEQVDELDESNEDVDIVMIN